MKRITLMNDVNDATKIIYSENLDSEKIISDKLQHLNISVDDFIKMYSDCWHNMMEIYKQGWNKNQARSDAKNYALNIALALIYKNNHK